MYGNTVNILKIQSYAVTFINRWNAYRYNLASKGSKKSINKPIFGTGDKAPTKAVYQTLNTNVTKEEKFIPLDKNETFPPIRSKNEAGKFKKLRAR